jgi:hypothetical protein
MSHMALAGSTDLRAPRLTIASAPVIVRQALGPRTVRVLAQAFCLAALVAAPSASLSGMQGLVAAQTLAAIAVFLVLRSSRTPVRATLGTLRIWGIGALVSLVTLTWMRDVLPLDLRTAQVGAVVALAALVVLGRMRDAYRDAGLKIDAILATLPPRTVPGHVEADHRSTA